MQPLSLQSRPLYASGITAGSPLNVGALATPQADAARPALAQSIPTGSLDMSAIMPMLMQLIQGLMGLMTQMFPQLSGAGAQTQSGQNPLSGYGGGYGAGNGAGTPEIPGAEDNGKGQGNGQTQGSGQSQDTGNGANLLPNNANVQEKSGVNYRDIPEDQRADFTHLNDAGSPTDERRAAAIIHIGGRANISGGQTESGVSPSAQIYNNILNNPDNFRPEEVSMVKEFSAKERAETASLTPDGQGFVTGKYLDYAFIEEMGNRDGISPEKISEYKGAVDQRIAKITDPNNPDLPQVIADSQKQLNIVDDIDTLQGQSGLTRTEQAAFRLAGHSVLFSKDGTVDQDILGISYQNDNALDSVPGASINPEIEAFASADAADDGQVNGSALRRGAESVMDKLYLKQGGLESTDAVLQQGQDIGLKNGRSMSQIQEAFTSGGKQALQDLKSLAKDHTPAMLAAGGSMAAASAVCPFLGGMAAGAAGIGAANNKLAK